MILNGQNFSNIIQKGQEIALLESTLGGPAITKVTVDASDFCCAGNAAGLATAVVSLPGLVDLELDGLWPHQLEIFMQSLFEKVRKKIGSERKILPMQTIEIQLQDWETGYSGTMASISQIFFNLRLQKATLRLPHLKENIAKALLNELKGNSTSLQLDIGPPSDDVLPTNHYQGIPFLVEFMKSYPAFKGVSLNGSIEDYPEHESELSISHHDLYLGVVPKQLMENGCGVLGRLLGDNPWIESVAVEFPEEFDRSYSEGVANGLISNKIIQKLAVVWVAVDRVGDRDRSMDMEPVLDAFQSLPNLKELMITFAHTITDATSQSFCDYLVLPTCRLESLEVFASHIQDEGGPDLQAILEACSDKPQFSCGSSLYNNRNVNVGSTVSHPHPSHSNWGCV